MKYLTCLKIVRKILFFCPVELVGSFPKEGPGIFISNHVSYFDPPLFATAFKTRVWFLAKKQIFEFPVIGRLLSQNNWALPVSDGKSMSIRLAIRMINEEKKLIVIYPEGERKKKNGKEILGKFHDGFYLIAKATKAPIYPLAIKGTEIALPRGSIIPRPAKIKIYIGEPFYFKDFPNQEEFIEIAREKIIALLNL